jgi:hypothetical protein
VIKIEIPEYLNDKNSNYFDKIEIDHSNKRLAKMIKSWLKIKVENKGNNLE